MSLWNAITVIRPKGKFPGLSSAELMLEIIIKIEKSVSLGD